MQVATTTSVVSPQRSWLVVTFSRAGPGWFSSGPGDWLNSDVGNVQAVGRLLQCNRRPAIIPCGGCDVGVPPVTVCTVLRSVSRSSRSDANVRRRVVRRLLLPALWASPAAAVASPALIPRPCGRPAGQRQPRLPKGAPALYVLERFEVAVCEAYDCFAWLFLRDAHTDARTVIQPTTPITKFAASRSGGSPLD